MSYANSAGVRLSSTTGGTTTGYLWDRLGSVDLLLDDGAEVYLNVDGSLAQIDDAGTTRHHLTDGLGSVRGLSDASGQLSGTADYSAFGEVRAQTGDTSLLGFTGEQHDAITGNVFLRSRYVDPSLGRFLSADSVQPNAPGTQGYNRYSYVANNPTTWIDPTGHQAQAVGWELNSQYLLIGSMIARYYLAACLAQPLGCAVIAALIIVAFILVACVLGGFDGACYLPGAVPNNPPKWWEENRKWDVPLPWIPSIPIPFTNTGDNADAKAKPAAPSIPMPNPPSDLNCINNPWPDGGKAPDWWWEFPPVSNQRLQTHINDLFRSTDTLPGGTAAAIRREMQTGNPTGGKFHTLKGEQRVQGLSNLIKSGKLNASDRAIAEWLENELTNALFGCGI